VTDAEEHAETLSDGVVTLRPWTEEDIAPSVDGHDAEIMRWFGQAEAPTYDGLRGVFSRWHEEREAGTRLGYGVHAGGRLVGGVEARPDGPVVSLSWWLFAGDRGQGYAARAVRLLADHALDDLGAKRVEAEIDARNTASLRVASRAGLRREGTRRVEPGMADAADQTETVVLARLASDRPVTEPEGFRALLNSFLPRKRAISQLIVRDLDGRVLICQLTYKHDWDLPGGVVEVGESPRLAAAREVHEELALDLPAGDLLLTDWLPPWSGWDDAVCLVFDGGAHDSAIAERIHRQEREIRHAEFATAEQVRERCADFTARRIESALTNLAAGGGPSYVESGGTPDVGVRQHPTS
jgi:RimJ/RimL family protein N-acetyltransferase/8-oxo-dGTP pyrophosphatase MutT (NUDIX family)